MFELFHQADLTNGSGWSSLLTVKVNFLERDELTSLAVSPLKNLLRDMVNHQLCQEFGEVAAFTVAYVPSPNFSSCWNELGWRFPD